MYLSFFGPNIAYVHITHLWNNCDNITLIMIFNRTRGDWVDERHRLWILYLAHFTDISTALLLVSIIIWGLTPPPIFLQRKNWLRLKNWVTYTLQLLFIQKTNENLVWCHFDRSLLVSFNFFRAYNLIIFRIYHHFAKRWSGKLQCWEPCNCIFVCQTVLFGRTSRVCYLSWLVSGMFMTIHLIKLLNY